MAGSESYKYLISWLQEGSIQNKFVKVKNRRQQDILRAAQDAFKVSGTCTMEWYVKDFDAFVIIDDDNELPSGGRAKLIQVEKPAATPPLAAADTVQLMLGTPDTDGVIPLIPVSSTPT